MAAVFLGGLFTFAFIGVLILARPLLVPVAASTLLAMTLMPTVNRIRAWGVPHALAATLVAGALAIALVVLAELLVEPLGKALDAIPALEGFGQRLWRLARAVIGAPYTDWISTQLQEAAAHADWGARLFAGLWEASALALTTAVLTFFLLVSGDLFLQKLVRVLPRIRDKVKAVKVVNAVQEDVSRYLGTVTLINAALGAVAGTISWYWELPAPLLWAVLVAAFNFVPYVGAVVNVLLLLAASAATYATLGEILTPPALFALVTAIEGHLITPMIVGRRTQLNAVVVVVGLLFWAWVWGIAGLVLAVPLLLVIKGFAAHIERLEPINEFMGR